MGSHTVLLLPYIQCTSTYGVGMVTSSDNTMECRCGRYSVTNCRCDVGLSMRCWVVDAMCDVGLSVRCWIVGAMLGCRCDVGLSVRCWVVGAMLGCRCDVGLSV